MRLIVAVLLTTAVVLPTSASAKVNTLTYDEAYQAATNYAADLIPAGPITVYNPTGFSLSPCERLSPIKFRCRDVLYYEDGPDTHLTISVQRMKGGRLKVSTRFPPLKRLTYREAHQAASNYAADLVPGPSSNYDPTVTGYSLSPCKRLSRTKFHCRDVLFLQDGPDTHAIISVQRVRSGRLKVSVRFLDGSPNVVG